MSKLRIGIVGYSGAHFLEGKARMFIIMAYNTIAQKYPNHIFTVVSGWTNLGVPKIAYEEAQKRGWGTAGIACAEASKYSCFPVSEPPKIVGTKWGDESQTFLNDIDIMVRIGGGPQTKDETEAFRRTGKEIFEYDVGTFKPQESILYR